ncbi:vesicular glutamate transporter 1-like isoform X1 [Schistocerca nitens]|uniref:vesicular glutamate transporter 1-like isoform X1 n=1 Tax=Schistocerca nitens TaxID=7011 RepID=UPI0021193F6D|nr:vesicular glutamate transporter 1-like isoform X1 [Schistocerca nitens]XP_049816103.1 vesicular glutamate transporter 1-like isoform X1 [Schistocerca nitens]
MILSRDGMTEVPLWKFWRRHRIVVTLLAFLGFFNVLALRVNVSVAIVAMTENKSRVLDNDTIVYGQEHAWGPRLQGLVLSSYFYGYVTTQVVGGWLALRVGGHLLFGLGIAIAAALTLLTPWLVGLGVYVFVALRVIEGIVEGVSYPAMHDVWGRWTPPGERNRLATLGYSGSYVGTVVAMTASGFLAARAGWPAIFYVFGAVGLLWFLAWALLVRRGPEFDSRIDPRECKYISEAVGDHPNTQVGPYPWGRFLTSMPVWAIIVANFTENWGFYTLLTQLPIFMKDTMDFDLEQAGLLSALPYLVVAASMQGAGHVADWLLNRGLLSTTQVRKVFCCGAFLGQSAFMLATAFLMTPAAAVACLTLAVGIGAFAMAGFFVNHLDLAPQYASILMGMANTAGTIPGIISPILTGYIVPNRTKDEWRVVFFISSTIYFCGSIFYGIFASGERQPWANGTTPKADLELQQKQPSIKKMSFRRQIGHIVDTVCGVKKYVIERNG